DIATSLTWSERLLGADPLATQAALMHAELLGRQGEPARAVRWLREHEQRQSAELGRADQAIIDAIGVWELRRTEPAEPPPPFPTVLRSRPSQSADEATHGRAARAPERAGPRRHQ